MKLVMVTALEYYILHQEFCSLRVQFSHLETLFYSLTSDRKMHNHIDLILIDKRWHARIIDA
jgi:hypothetical protein